MTEVASGALTDREVQEAVLQALAHNVTVHANEIGVIVQDRIVTLTGTVASYAKRCAAEEATERVRGVRAVANEIHVRLPSSAERTDAELASACLMALQLAAAVPTGALHITVSKGSVTLRGELDLPSQRESAERAVQGIAGVTGVINRVMVKPHSTPNDVKHRIERALVRSAEVDARRISVEVQNSTVILRGHVSSYAEWQAAERSAWSATDITHVDNQLTVVVPE